MVALIQSQKKVHSVGVVASPHLCVIAQGEMNKMKVRCIECDKWVLMSTILAKIDKNPQGNCGSFYDEWKQRLGLTMRYCDDFIPLSEERKRQNRLFASQSYIQTNPLHSDKRKMITQFIYF